MRVAGIMSGTSLDGIDVAVVDIDKKGRRVVAHRSFDYPAALRSRLLAVSNAEVHVSEISRLNFLLPEHYARAVKKCGVPLDSIELIGCHGQTIFHERGSTLQIGDGSILAERTGVPVVSDFRTRDMAAGGHGAPLVPFVDFLLYRDDKLGRVSLNIGGIANITAIPSKAQSTDVIAFDTGPGNMLIDQLVQQHTNGKMMFDVDGRLAASGNLEKPLLKKLMSNRYFGKRPPKTAGREQYGRELIAELQSSKIPILNLITTATAFTASSIAFGVNRFAGFVPDELIVSGGGAHNRTLLGYIQALLPETRLRKSNEFGVDSDAKEAIAFAILAYETWQRRPSNLPSATGARHPVVLGKVSY